MKVGYSTYTDIAVDQNIHKLDQIDLSDIINVNR